jgi:hypothetical protein
MDLPGKPQIIMSTLESRVSPIVLSGCMAGIPREGIETVGRVEEHIHDGLCIGARSAAEFPFLSAVIDWVDRAMTGSSGMRKSGHRISARIPL